MGVSLQENLCNFRMYLKEIQLMCFLFWQNDNVGIFSHVI